MSPFYYWPLSAEGLIESQKAGTIWRTKQPLDDIWPGSGGHSMADEEKIDTKDFRAQLERSENNRLRG